MEFSKDNIVSKSFAKKFLGGLDEFEVRDFLHVLAEEIRHLNKKIAFQTKKIQEQEDLIGDYRDREHILRESIVSAEKWAEKIRKDAENNSSLILEKAHNKSEALIQEARHSLQSVYTDIMDLKRLHLQFKTGLKAALQVQMDLLEQDPVFGQHSSLPTTNIENVLEEDKSKATSKEEADSASTVKSFDQNNLNKKELFKQKTETTDNLKKAEKDIQSLRESLKSLDKTFS